MTEREFEVRLAHWPDDINPIRDIRTTVFIDEQRVAPAEEWDGMDDQCLHALAFDRAGNAIGTGRLLPDGKIGRMAVLKEWRGKGVGGAILELLMDEARANGHATAKLAAQLHAIPFYERYGYEAYGEEFMDAGIPHRWMRAPLTAGTTTD